jgi:arabinan endo-1,5-alpha-L-arabinosidase
MKSRILLAAGLALLFCGAARTALAQLAGEPYIHDPSTVILDDGKYYTFGTGGGGLISDDGWTWHSGAVRPGGGVAPDVIKIGDRYWMSYAAGGGGMSGGHASNVHTMWTKTLDPKSPDFGFHDDTIVASSDGVEDCDAIDPAFLLAEGRLWLSYGTYFGNIRIVELDPKTGKRVAGNEPVDVSIDMEATDLMYRDGWYYLLGTHGTCCDSANSTYNIRVGRSRSPLGPYVDNMGVPLLKGGGKLVAAASGRHYGLGHFGLLDLGDEVQKFSVHYEADMDRSGRSVLEIRPLLWKNGWPVGGDNFEAGTYEIQSERSGFALELAVDFVRIDDGRRHFGFGGPPPMPPADSHDAKPGTAAQGDKKPKMPPMPPEGFFGPPKGPVKPLPDQTLAQDSANWPKGDIEVRMNDYMVRPHQKWTITPAPNAGGYPGAPYFKIVIAGTERALAATADNELITVPAFNGAPEQLWRIDQLTDGTYRIMPKTASSSKEPVALTAIGDSTVTLTRFDPKGDKARWNFKKP